MLRLTRACFDAWLFVNSLDALLNQQQQQHLVIQDTCVRVGAIE
jgi:hypothetical protein